ncbi:hypothetical protein BDU57DRAFT_479646 [Ampelomyces quisqualis]|uniref:Uncharacterized protein n=1 Tax=Ampelomyces quisqualis TaxID=50730 RepID=A0A6A5QG32_AMPQU|nr:hypothetical protein BDU57DRAFT_479646 [Ampelomyces quisqualis]
MGANPSVPHPVNQQPTNSPHSPSLPSQIITFFALYLTTLFSLDAFAAARNSPHRAPSSAAIYRPANTPSEYQAGMHGRGAGGPSSGGGGGAGGNGRGMGEVRDSRPPVGMGSTAACGACMT